MGRGPVPGRSSAGSGVAVAVGSAFAALGTDTGGSIRVPASVNGIVGVKPTFGLVDTCGVVPLSWSLDHVGVLARTVEDSVPVLEAIAGPGSHGLGRGLEAGVDEMVLGVEREHHFYDGVRRDVREAVERVIAEYERLGAPVIEVELGEFRHMAGVGRTIMTVEAGTFHAAWLRERASAYDPATRAMIEVAQFVPATAYLRAQQARTVLVARVRDLFDRHGLDAMLAPTLPIPTVPISDLHLAVDGHEPAFSRMVHHTFTANVVGLPAISVPCGLSTEGYPIAFELMGRPFAEARLLRIGRAYEREHQADRSLPALGGAPAVGF